MVAAFESSAFESTAFEESAPIVVVPAYGTPGYYPTSAAATRFRAAGLGTWLAGYLFNESSGNLAATFGTPTLTPSGTAANYGIAGPLGGTDKAISFGGTNTRLDGGNVFDVGATDDLVVAFVAKWTEPPSGDAFGTVLGKIEASAVNGWGIVGTADDYYLRIGSSGTAYGSNLGAGSHMAGRWHVGMVAISRATGTCRFGIRALDTTGETILGDVKPVSGSLSTSATFRVGATGWVATHPTIYQLAGLYVGTGIGIAAGVVENLDAVLASFADGLFPDVYPVTTREALAAGSASLRYVVAIEGYDHILTDFDPRKAIAAWNSGATVDWQQALPNLAVQMTRTQSLSPWEPFDKGKDWTFSVQAEQFAEYGANKDQFGVDTHRRASGAATQLTATVDRDDTTINVKSTAAFAGSGEMHLGTECIEYSATTPTTFTASKRGKYSPFLTATGARYAEHHRVGDDSQGVQLEPEVSEYPRNWKGRWVGVWLHVTDGERLNSKDDALLVYSGRWQGVTDDPDTGNTIVTVKSILDTVANTSFGRDLWSASVQPGIQLGAGTLASFRDFNGSVWKFGTALTVVASGATGTNQINAGRYSSSELADAINAWLAGELSAGRIYGSYFLNPAEDYNGSKRAVMHSYIPAASTTSVRWQFDLPTGLLGAFGLTSEHWYPPARSANAWHPEESPNTPDDHFIFKFDGSTFTYTTTIEAPSGQFVDQYDLLPASVRALIGPKDGHDWGVFLFNEETLLVGWFDGIDTLHNIQIVDVVIQGGLSDLTEQTLNAGDPLPPVRQVYLLEMRFGDAPKYLLYGSGTPGHNHATWDALGYGLGIGIPGGMLGADFDASCDNLPGADNTIVVRIEKQTKLADLFRGDLVLRRSFPRWKSPGLRMGTWATPSTDAAIATLDEDNKAEPANANSVNPRSITIEAADFVKPVIKVLYNYEFSADGGKAQKILALEDRVSVDDSGGEGESVEIEARNTYGQFQNTGTGVELLWPGFMAAMPMFTRPTSKTTRSMASTLYEEIGVGDCIEVTDDFARDPVTGERGVLLRPALVTRHTASYGGAGANQLGEVEVLFLDQNRIAAYAPAAVVDSGAANGGYDAATKTLTCLPHEHSESSEPVDASRFAAGYKVRIVEVDPDDPDDVLFWNTEVVSVTGNAIVVADDLTDWDASKLYRVIFDSFSLDTTAEQIKTFQADATTGLLVSTGAPYQYGIQQPTSFTVNSGGELAELHATSAYGDGVPRDTGYERGLVRTLNALIDYKTAHQSPALSNTILENTTYSSGGGWQLQGFFPLALNSDRYPIHVTRSLRVAPWFRSSTGASAKLRVTVSASPISTSNTSKNDVTIPGPSVSQEWTTTSTTWGTGTEQTLELTFKPLSGIVWVYVECSLHCQTRLLAECTEGPRT
jgi:hypothetical protein